MSKSLGNVITLDDIIEKWIEPLAFKYFIYLAHYKSIQDFSWEDLQAVSKSYNRLKWKIKNEQWKINNFIQLKLDDIKKIYKNKEEGWKLIDYLLDDLDTVKLIAEINRILNNEECSITILALIKYIDDKILKLDLFKVKKEKIEIPEKIRHIAEKRWQAKKEKNFELADKLREEIIQKGYQVIDKKEGYEIIINRKN